MWYSDYVGEEFDVVYEEVTEYVVREPEEDFGYPYLNIIKKSDSEVVRNEES